MKYTARDLSLGGLIGGLGIAIPIFFHLVGLGTLFLPMHLPIVVGGMFLSPTVALVVGAITPLLSSMLTGMPPLVPVGVLMSGELATLALAASVFRRKMNLPVIVAAIGAILAARIVGGLERLALAPILVMKQGVYEYLIFSIVTSWPGVLLQLIAAPAVVKAIETTPSKAR